MFGSSSATPATTMKPGRDTTADAIAFEQRWHRHPPRSERAGLPGLACARGVRTLRPDSARGRVRSSAPTHGAAALVSACSRSIAPAESAGMPIAAGQPRPRRPAARGTGRAPARRRGIRARWPPLKRSQAADGDDADCAGAWHVRAAARRQVEAFDLDQPQRPGSREVPCGAAARGLLGAREPDGRRPILPDHPIGFVFGGAISARVSSRAPGRSSTRRRRGES